MVRAIILVKSPKKLIAARLKKINYVIDESPVIDSKHLDLLIWASTYYHHPIGEVIHNALPTLLRKNDNTNIVVTVFLFFIRLLLKLVIWYHYFDFRYRGRDIPRR